MRPPLRIAVDARPLTHPYTGIGQYLLRVLDELQTISEHRFFLYGNGCDVEPPAHWANTVWRTTRRNAALLNHWHARFTFPRWARADDCDVYFAPRHFLPPLRSNIAGVLTLHDLVWRTHPETMRRGGRVLERLTTPGSIARADQLLTTTASVRADIIALAPDAAERLRVAPLAATVDVDRPPAADGPAARPYFVFCGTMEPRKNLARLLAAFEQLIRSSEPPAHQLVIISSAGWDNDDVRRRLAKLGGSVRVASGADDAEKTRLIAGADFLVQPSLHEGFGLPVVDALALGTPVLAANAGALPEVAGDAAIYVDPLREDDIRDKLARLCRDTQLREQLAAAARRRAKRFSWRNTTEITLAAIEEAALARSR